MWGLGLLRGRSRPGTRAVGRRGERIAARAMRRAGCRVVARNVRTRTGEVDLICADRASGAIVFVEVKARWCADPARGEPSAFRPELNITAHKRRQVVAVAMGVARARGWTDRPLRIDVVAVEMAHRRAPVVRHYADAIRGPVRS